MSYDCSIDAQKITSYIETLVKIPSPTGFTNKIVDFLINNAKEKNINFTKTKKGAVIYNFLSQKRNKDKRNIMFNAHIDTLGAMVKEIQNNTFKIASIGDYPAFYVVGNYCKIHTFDNNEYFGTILPDNPSVHTNNDIHELKLTLKDLHIRVDIDNSDDKKLTDYFEIGNFVTFDPNYSHTNGYIKSRHLDDKSSAGILLYIADILNENKLNIKNNVYLYFNITEETGQGVSGLPEIDELINVDMGVVGDTVNGSEYHVSICVKDSSGPYNYDINQKLINIAKENNIAYKVDIFPYYESDGAAVISSGKDVAIGLIGPGVSASHGYERTHEKGLINTAKLILHYIE